MSNVKAGDTVSWIDQITSATRTGVVASVKDGTVYIRNPWSETSYDAIDENRLLDDSGRLCPGCEAGWSERHRGDCPENVHTIQFSNLT